jgi:RimJ/RimL family protein N-acetyltransferase
MVLQQPLETARLVLRSLSEADVTDQYVSWLKDPEINRYLELRRNQHSIESTRDSIRALNSSSDALLLGIVVKTDHRHIGNIKLGSVDTYHRRADIGLLLGDRGEWGKGYATEAIAAVAAYGFEVLQLEKIWAGCYSENTGSVKAFQKAGFALEGRLAEHCQSDTGRQDQLLLGLTAERYMKIATKWKGSLG